ncbi:MAG: DUF362 domain-containing protein [Armatimonadota bacterium]
MTDKLNRREFLKRAGIISVATCGLTLVGDDILGFLDEAEAAGKSMLSIGSGGSPEAMVKKAVNGLGGIKKFVKPGQSVLIKPNIAWARTPGQAANTNPQIITALVKMCKEAGAKRITVFDHTCDPSVSAFRVNGAKEFIPKSGAKLIAGDSQSMYKRISIPKGKILKTDECFRELLDADVFINVPIAKSHGASVITASMKNLMGTNWDRGVWHNAGLDQCIADYATVVKADLIVLDATRILMNNGPKGPGETKDVNQVIASTDPVAVDAYAATLLGKKPAQIGHIVAASKMGLGQIDLKKVTVKKA